MLNITSVELQSWLAQGFWPFTRILALFTIAPIYYQEQIPMPVKVALAMAVTILIVPSLPVPDVSLSSSLGPMWRWTNVSVGSRELAGVDDGADFADRLGTASLVACMAGY